MTLAAGNLAWVAVYRASTANLPYSKPNLPPGNRPPYIQIAVVIDGASTTQQTLNLGPEPQSTDPKFEADYVRYVAWAKKHCPSLTPPAPLAGRCHVRYLLARPRSLEQTTRGLVQESTGKVLAPPGSTYIGDGYTPLPRVVQACRAGSSRNPDCGLYLTIADGKFHPKPTYRQKHGAWYSPHAIAKAITDAGYPAIQ